MNRLLAAVCAAMLFTGSLTACSTNDANNGNGSGTGSASPTGTSYHTAPGGANEDRGVGGRRTSARDYTAPADNGRYTAYSDGSLAADRDRPQKNGDTPGEELARGARDMINGVGNAVRDMTGMNRSNNANGNSGNAGTNGPTANSGTGPAAKGIAGAKGATIGGSDGIGNSTT